MTPETSSRVRWLLISWLFVLSAVAFLDRVNLSIAGGALSAEYHLTNVQFGFLSTALLIGYTLFQTPAGWLADRFGPRAEAIAVPDATILENQCGGPCHQRALPSRS